jgi:PPK2 family polyphosphate:nucleotide phosphotransferase
MSQYDLHKLDTNAPQHFEKDATKIKTEKIIEALNELQNLLYAEGKRSILIILQGLDASGKDGAIRKVFGKMNPQGVDVVSFKVPTEEELSHDFLWRIHKNTPQKGHIQIFNRSHYEDILVTRVHGWCDDKMAVKRMKAINDFEELLQEHNHTHILKFYLHVSAEEQQKRLKERMTDPSKMWKYNQRDFEEAKLRDAYYMAFQDCFKNCNQPEWMIVPSDQNWYKEYVIANALYDVMKGLDMKYPTLSDQDK